MTDTNDMRREFEAWFTGPVGTNFLTQKDGAYTLISAQTSWVSWQAATERATALERECCAAVCNDLASRWCDADECAEAIRQGGAG